MCLGIPVQITLPGDFKAQCVGRQGEVLVDMSLVGPRPLLMEYLPLYSSEQSRRHEVRPGVTGWAQINGRNALTWDEKFKLQIIGLKH